MPLGGPVVTGKAPANPTGPPAGGNTGIMNPAGASAGAAGAVPPTRQAPVKQNLGGNAGPYGGIMGGAAPTRTPTRAPAPVPGPTQSSPTAGQAAGMFPGPTKAGPSYQTLGGGASGPVQQSPGAYQNGQMVQQQQQAIYGPAGNPQYSTDPYVRWANAQSGIINAQTGLQNSALDLQLSQGQGNYNWGMGGLRDDAGFDRRYLQNDQTRLGADRLYQGASRDNLNALYGISQDRYGAQQSQNTENLGFSDRRWQDQRAQNADNRGFVGQQYGNQMLYNGEQRGLVARNYTQADQMAQQQYGMQNRSAATDATARGSVLSGGYAQERTDIGQTRDLALQQAGITRDSSISNLDQSDRSALLTRDKGLSDLTYNDRGNDLTHDRDTSGLKYSDLANDRAMQTDTANYQLGQAGADRQDTYLSALAKDYGVKGDQIENALQRGAQKLGMDWSALKGQIGNLKQQNGLNGQAQQQAILYQLLNANLATANANNTALQARNSGTSVYVNNPALAAGSMAGAAVNKPAGQAAYGAYDTARNAVTKPGQTAYSLYDKARNAVTSTFGSSVRLPVPASAVAALKGQKPAASSTSKPAATSKSKPTPAKTTTRRS